MLCCVNMAMWLLRQSLRPRWGGVSGVARCVLCVREVAAVQCDGYG